MTRHLSQNATILKSKWPEMQRLKNKVQAKMTRNPKVQKQGISQNDHNSKSKPKKAQFKSKNPSNQDTSKLKSKFQKSKSSKRT